MAESVDSARLQPRPDPGGPASWEPRPLSTDDPHALERLAARLAEDAGFAAFAQPGSALLIWDGAANRVLWASPAAQGLRDALAGPGGHVSPDLPIRGKLLALSGGLAPTQSFRLERLRLDPLSAPVTCACRRATTDDGEEVLVT